MRPPLSPRPAILEEDRRGVWGGKALIAAVALICLAGLAAGLPALSGKTVVDEPEVRDIGNQWLGFAAFLERTYRQGHFPLWDPHDLCGMPFLAFSHTSSLYLPWAAAHLALTGYPAAAAFNIFLHLSLAGVFTLLLFRRLGHSTAVAFAAALAYAFSGFLFENINFPPSLHTGTWLPLWYAMTLAILSRPRLSNFLPALLALAAMIFGGDLEMTIYAGLGLGFEIILRAREKKLPTPGLAAALFMLAAGAFLALPQLLPAVELARHSVRTGETFVPELWIARLAIIPFYAIFQIPIPLSLFPPNHGLDPWYLGAIFLPAGAAILRSPSPERRRLLIFPAALIYMILFYFPPFNSIFYRVPVLGGLMVPLRAWPTLHLFFLFAAAAGLERWIEEGRAGEESSSRRPFSPAAGVFLGGVALLTAVSLYWIRQGMALRIVFCGCLLAMGILVLVKRPARLGSAVRAALVVFLVTLDLYGLALGWLPRTDPRRLEPEPAVRDFLSDTAGRERYFILSGHGIIDRGLPYHLGLRLNADTIDAFSRLPPRSSALRLARLYPALFRRDKKGRLIQYDQMALRDPTNLNPRGLDLLNRMNVSRLVSRYPWRPASQAVELVPRAGGGGMYFYENRNAWPRAWLEVEGGRRPLRAGYPAGDRVQVEAGWSGAGEAAAADSLRRVTLADSWYPGWRAEWRGEELRIEKADLDFRRLQIRAPGEINLYFIPASFRIGLNAGLASTAFFLAGLVKAGCVFQRTGGRREHSGKNCPP